MATEETLSMNMTKHRVLQHCTWFATGNATAMTPVQSAKNLI